MSSKYRDSGLDVDNLCVASGKIKDTVGDFTRLRSDFFQKCQPVVLERAPGLVIRKEERKKKRSIYDRAFGAVSLDDGYRRRKRPSPVRRLAVASAREMRRHSAAPKIYIRGRIGRARSRHRDSPEIYGDGGRSAGALNTARSCIKLA